MRLLVTGGAGFVGSNLVAYLAGRHPDWHITVLDALVYSGRVENIPRDIRESGRFELVVGDVRDAMLAADLLRNADAVVHLAAQTHVDRSIADATPFVMTDVHGTQVMLDAARRRAVARFIHMSTSEVYGTARGVPITEEHPLEPASPYAAAKAGADRLAYSYWRTYGLPVVILRSFNIYGPRQHVEKMNPLFITNALDGKPLPVYGDGSATRDWLHVDDVCRAIEATLAADISELAGEAVNLGTGRETSAVGMARMILAHLGLPEERVSFVADRPGHVTRLCSSVSKARQLLSWAAQVPLEPGLARTIDWYAANEEWWRPLAKQGDALGRIGLGNSRDGGESVGPSPVLAVDGTTAHR